MSLLKMVKRIEPRILPWTTGDGTFVQHEDFFPLFSFGKPLCNPKKNLTFNFTLAETQTQKERGELKGLVVDDKCWNDERSKTDKSKSWLIEFISVKVYSLAR